MSSELNNAVRKYLAFQKLQSERCEARKELSDFVDIHGNKYPDMIAWRQEHLSFCQQHENIARDEVKEAVCHVRESEVIEKINSLTNEIEQSTMAYQARHATWESEYAMQRASYSKPSRYELREKKEAGRYRVLATLMALLCLISVFFVVVYFVCDFIKTLGSVPMFVGIGLMLITFLLFLKMYSLAKKAKRKYQRALDGRKQDLANTEARFEREEPKPEHLGQKRKELGIYEKILVVIRHGIVQ